MGLTLFNFFYLRDEFQKEFHVSNMEENLQIASCCAEKGYAREMVTYLYDAGKFGKLDNSLVGKILDTYKKYGWNKELKNVKKTKVEQFDEKEANYVLSLLTPENYEKAITDFEFGWFFDSFGYTNVEFVLSNAKEMINYSRPCLENNTSSHKHLPSMLNVPLKYHFEK